MRQPWDITREMFLSEDEELILLSFLQEQIKEKSSGEQTSAVVDRLIIEILMYSGIRNTEFCHLTMADTIAGHGESAITVRGTPKQNRTIFVPKILSVFIQEYIQKIRPHYLPDDVDPKDLSQPLIFNERKRPYERTALYRRVVRILNAGGLGSRASVQLLRHTYGYLAYKRSGGNLLFVQKQLGHAHPMVTSVYARFVEEPYEELAERILSISAIEQEKIQRARRRKIR